MKSLTLILLGLSSLTAFSQRATFKNDTLTYKDRKFVVGDTVNLGYGSGENGRFVFVSTGSGIGGTTPAEAANSKSVLVIDKIYKNSSGLWVRAKIIEGPKGLSKAFINSIEGAVDKKEID